MTTFTAIQQAKPYHSIVDQVLERIHTGELEPGSALPSARLLAEQFNVTRGSVREALRVLEHAEIVEVKAGSGTYVTPLAQSKAAMMRAHAAAAGDHSPLDVIVARQAVEPMCARLAADNNGPSELSVIRELVDEHRRINVAVGDPSEVDFRFHLAVANASHNSVLSALMDQLVQIMHQRTWRQLKRHTRESRAGADLFLQEHEAILVALENRDSGSAEQRMTDHIRSIESRLINAYEDHVLDEGDQTTT